MKDSLRAGMTTSRKLVVDKPRTISHLGEGLRVYATPELIRDIEQTCLAFIAEHADPGEHSVGTGIELKHLASTPMGMQVEIKATVAKVDGRAIDFEVTASDGIDEICRCKHNRFVVLIDKVKERVAAKKAKAGLG
jgi:predicted thioesterase